MQCIITYTHIWHALIEWTLSIFLLLSSPLSLILYLFQPSTLYWYLKSDLSLREWFLWRLHWKVAGLVKQKLPLKNYFYRSKLNFVSNVFYLINGTKEAKIWAVVPRWRGHWVSVRLQYVVFLIIFAKGLPMYQGTMYEFHFFSSVFILCFVQ